MVHRCTRNFGPSNHPKRTTMKVLFIVTAVMETGGGRRAAARALDGCFSVAWYTAGDIDFARRWPRRWSRAACDRCRVLAGTGRGIEPRDQRFSQGPVAVQRGRPGGSRPCRPGSEVNPRRLLAGDVAPRPNDSRVHRVPSNDARGTLRSRSIIHDSYGTRVRESPAISRTATHSHGGGRVTFRCLPKPRRRLEWEVARGGPRSNGRSYRSCG